MARSSLPDPGVVEAWATYAKDRFDWADKRVNEYRHWARQLATATAVIIGLELTLVGASLDLQPPTRIDVRNEVLLVILVASLLQGILLVWLLWKGYGGRVTLIGPESPTVLARFLDGPGVTDAEARQIIGAYYAKSFDEFLRFSERLGRTVSDAAVVLAISLVLFYVGVAKFWQQASVLPPSRAYDGAVMGEPRKVDSRPSPAAPANGRPAAAPSRSPVPTSGRPSAKSPLLITPTPGQPVTSGYTGKIYRG